MTRLDDSALALLFRDARTHNGWTDQPVTDDELKAAVDLAKMGPTSANTSPMRLLFVRSAEAKEKLRPSLGAGNLAKTLAAPVVAIVAFDPTFYEHLGKLFPHNLDARNWFAGDETRGSPVARLNSALQAGYLLLALRAVGLDTGPMTGFDASKVDAAFFSDGSAKTFMLINIGHGDASKLFPRSPRFAFDEMAEIV